MINFDCPFCKTHHDVPVKSMLWFGYVCVCGKPINIEMIADEEVITRIKLNLADVARLFIRTTKRAMEGSIAKNYQARYTAGMIQIYDAALTRIEKRKIFGEPQHETIRGGEQNEKNVRLH